MFIVIEADAAAIRTAFERKGALSAAIELRERFRGITDNAKARACLRSIVGWAQPPEPDAVIRLRPCKDSRAAHCRDDGSGHARARPHDLSRDNLARRFGDNPAYAADKGLVADKPRAQGVCGTPE
ncbi:hypothetical protein CCS01_22650 [Rhodopila globiformis]|uniref:Uncharacterized protein n=1 Tax=Rhodopila globiformis TaxID=1071 RepID=A0A2S6N353_RHOGL|nr:hypothetical protein CCS01_22650 [Rhodopila globiformis]